MKRIVKIGIMLFSLSILSAGIITAQEKKSEQKIKIVVADKDGTKVIIDTLIKGGTMADSVKLKNGEVIYLTRNGKGVKEVRTEGDHSTTFVTYSKSEKGGKGEKGEKGEKTITIISGDSISNIEGGDNEVVIVKNGKGATQVKGGKVVTWSSSSSSSNSKKSIEKTKYVIAKDGMVVTIEGNDEAKAKELMDEIQAKLGVNKEDNSTKKVVKEETKKTNKK